MNNSTENKFHFDRHFGMFVGKLADNKLHKHYAQQISVSNKTNMTLTLQDEKIISGKTFFINSKVTHKLTSDTIQLTILINPLSSIGHLFYIKFAQSNLSEIKDNLSNELIEALKKYENKEVEFEELCGKITKIITQYKCSCELENHLKDDRVIKAIEFMDNSFEKVLSLEEVSAFCNLSPTRFLHLFKEKTNLNFRRYQLWNKLIKSLPYLVKNSITDTAYTFGFSDSSHYTRTFIETFGVTPKFLLSKQ